MASHQMPGFPRFVPDDAFFQRVGRRLAQQKVRRRRYDSPSYTSEPSRPQLPVWALATYGPLSVYAYKCDGDTIVSCRASRSPRRQTQTETRQTEPVRKSEPSRFQPIVQTTPLQTSEISQAPPYERPGNPVSAQLDQSGLGYGHRSALTGSILEEGSTNETVVYHANEEDSTWSASLHDSEIANAAATPLQTSETSQAPPYERPGNPVSAQLDQSGLGYGHRSALTGSILEEGSTIETVVYHANEEDSTWSAYLHDSEIANTAAAESTKSSLTFATANPSDGWSTVLSGQYTLEGGPRHGQHIALPGYLLEEVSTDESDECHEEDDGSIWSVSVHDSEVAGPAAPRESTASSSTYTTADNLGCGPEVALPECLLEEALTDESDKHHQDDDGSTWSASVHDSELAIPEYQKPFEDESTILSGEFTLEEVFHFPQKLHLPRALIAGFAEDLREDTIPAWILGEGPSSGGSEAEVNEEGSTWSVSLPDSLSLAAEGFARAWQREEEGEEEVEEEVEEEGDDDDGTDSTDRSWASLAHSVAGRVATAAWHATAALRSWLWT